VANRRSSISISSFVAGIVWSAARPGHPERLVADRPSVANSIGAAVPDTIRPFSLKTRVAEDAVIDSVLDLLAEAIFEDLRTEFEDDGSVPLGNEP
jgi:hypothetical protein